MPSFGVQPAGAVKSVALFKTWVQILVTHGALVGSVVPTVPQAAAVTVSVWLFGPASFRQCVS